MRKLIYNKILLIVLLNPLLASDNAAHRDPLYNAIVKNDKNEVVRILNTNVNIDTVYDDGMTPLILAVKSGNKEMVSLILSKNPDIYKKNALSYIKTLDIAEVLYGTFLRQIPSEYWPQVGLQMAIDAAENKYDLPLIKYYIDQGVNVKDSPTGGINLLHLLATYPTDATDLINYVLKKGANINEKSAEYKITPLSNAILNNGHKNNIKFLIDNGADLNIGTNEGKSPLHLAVEKNNPDIVKLLVSKGADVNTQNIYGMTPLLLAVRINYMEKIENMEVIKVLVSQKGADVNLPDTKGRTPLHDTRNMEVIKFLVSKKANPLAKDNNGDTPLGAACNNRDMIKYFLSNIPKINPDDPDMAGILYQCISNFESVDILLAHGFNMNMKNSDGNTVLHLMADFGDYELVEGIINRGADVNARNNNGDTPIQFLETTEHQYIRDIADLMISKGADLDIKNKMGVSPRKKVLEILKLPSNLFKIYDNVPLKNGQFEKWEMVFPVWPGVEKVRCNKAGNTCLYIVKISDEYDEEAFEKEVKKFNNFYAGKKIGEFTFDSFKKLKDYPGYGWEAGTTKKGVEIVLSHQGTDIVVYIYPNAPQHSRK